MIRLWMKIYHLILIENQGGRQIKAIQNQGKIKTIKKHAYSDKDIPVKDKDSPVIPKQKEIFNKLVDERVDEITVSD